MIDQKLSAISPNSLLRLFSQAPVALALLQGDGLTIEAANEQILSLWGKGADVIGKDIIVALPELEGQPFIDILKKVKHTGEPFYGNKMPATLVKDGVPTVSYFNFIYSPVYNAENVITGVSIVATDVTQHVKDEEKLAESQYSFKELIANADYSTAIYTGPDLIIEFANEKMLNTWGKTKEVIGKKLADALPELQGQPFLDILRIVYANGEKYTTKADYVELEIDGKLKGFYYNFSYKPLFNLKGEVYAILNMAVDVTEQVLQRKAAELAESRLRDLFNKAPLALSYLKGADFVIEISNVITQNLWGHKSSKIGKKLAEVYPELEGHEIMEHLKLAYESGKQVTVKEMCVQQPGEECLKYLNYLLHPILDKNGQTEYILSIGFDVTEEVEAKQKLKESEARFRLLADAMPQIVWTTDSRGAYNYFNKQFYEYTGLAKTEGDEIIFNELIVPDHKEIATLAWEQCLDCGKDLEVEYQLYDYKNPGNPKWFLSRAMPVKNEDQVVQQWIGTSTDIHEFKVLQKQKDTFLGIASHELKTPLTSLKIYAQVLERTLRKAGDLTNADLAAKMDKQINRLNLLIAELLDVTKIQNGKMELNESNFNFTDLVKEIGEEIQLTSNHKIVFELQDSGSINADRQRIGQVITNFVNNAIKYSPDADRVILSVSATDKDVTFSVEDFGIGIAPDKIGRVFEQYYRVSGNKEHTFPGLGLGLFISGEIIKRSGGQYEVKSEPGKGSTFSFTIPKSKHNYPI